MYWEAALHRVAGIQGYREEFSASAEPSTARWSISKVTLFLWENREYLQHFPFELLAWRKGSYFLCIWLLNVGVCWLVMELRTGTWAQADAQWGSGRTGAVRWGPGHPHPAVVSRVSVFWVLVILGLGTPTAPCWGYFGCSGAKSEAISTFSSSPDNVILGPTWVTVLNTLFTCLQSSNLEGRELLKALQPAGGWLGSWCSWRRGGCSLSVLGLGWCLWASLPGMYRVLGALPVCLFLVVGSLREGERSRKRGQEWLKQCVWLQPLGSYL